MSEPAPRRIFTSYFAAKTLGKKVELAVGYAAAQVEPIVVVVDEPGLYDWPGSLKIPANVTIELSNDVGITGGGIS